MFLLFFQYALLALVFVWAFAPADADYDEDAGADSTYRGGMVTFRVPMPFVRVWR